MLPNLFNAFKYEFSQNDVFYQNIAILVINVILFYLIGHKILFRNEDSANEGKKYTKSRKKKNGSLKNALKLSLLLCVAIIIFLIWVILNVQNECPLENLEIQEDKIPFFHLEISLKLKYLSHKQNMELKIEHNPNRKVQISRSVSNCCRSIGQWRLF